MTAKPDGEAVKVSSAPGDIEGRVPGSFRDPSGYVFCAGDEYYRVINPCYIKNWRLVTESGFAKKAIDTGLLLPFEPVASSGLVAGVGETVIKAKKIPFVSYPYEWSFGQLKAAAIHTLKLQLLALEFGLILKDASAYNIQFLGTKATFIDHLSFEEYVDGKPWSAYQQFCKHFYGPLLLVKYFDFTFLKMLAQNIDGFPLDFVSKLLPATSWLSPSIALHIHAHAKMTSKYSDGRKAAQKVKNLSVSKGTISKLCQSLLSAVEGINLPKVKTEWGDYYQDTNYTDLGRETKTRLVEQSAAMNAGALAVDLGANTGVFSEVLARHYNCVVSSDIDALAVERNYNAHVRTANETILPIVLDLGNPSQPLGWAGKERFSFQQRVSADCMTALALIHHLVMTAGVPFALISEFFASLMNKDGVLILEFVPKEDSQVQRLLAAREDIFYDYNKENCVNEFSQYFSHIEEHAIDDSLRTVHVFRRK